MVSIKLKFRPSTIEGKAGSLYYQIICNRVIRQIPIPYRIFSEEWNRDNDELIINFSSMRANYLESIRRIVQCDVERIKRIVSNLSSNENSLSIDIIVAKFQEQASGHSFFGYMEQMISQYLRQGQNRTSETYATTLSSFRKFRGEVDLCIEDVNSELMEAYESYLKQNNLAPNTISFYMKHLRAVYNRAVDDELVIDKRPFKRVSTAIERTAKRAITLRIIKELKSMDLSYNPSKQFARDMFLFSFYTRGMSFIDIAFLSKKSLKGDVLFYRRKKTNQQLMIHWEKCMQEIVNRYEAETSSPYLFSIIQKINENHRKQYQNAMCRVNRQLKIIGHDLGLHQPLTMYCARHSWASIARDEGIPLSVISEGMGHNSEKTTQIYLTSLKTEIVDKANRKILKLL